MEKTRFTRRLCLVLAVVLCLVGNTALLVSADTPTNNLTDKSIKDYKAQMDTISYEEYEKANFYADDVSSPENTAAFSLVDNWVFTYGAIKITMTGGVWKMTVGDATYNSVDEAVAAGYEKSSLAYVTEYDGVQSVYTPDQGSITWTLDLAGAGISQAILCNVALQYYPVIAKAASIEREFYINGEVPFSESRSLTLAKLWGSFEQGSKNDGKSDAKLVDLTATYTLGNKESVEGMNIPKDLTYIASDDGKTVTFVRPMVLTPEIIAFVDEYKLRFFPTDTENNEVRPTQLQNPEWTTYIFRDSDGFSHDYTATDKEGNVLATFNSDFFGFVIRPDEGGKVSVTLKSVNEPMALSEIRLMPYTQAPSYEAYRADVVGKVGDAHGTSVVRIEAEYPTTSSTNVVYPVEDRSSAATSPSDAWRTVLNTIGTEKWETSGQWLEYKFKVDSSGFYDIYSRFKQSYLDGMYVSRSLQLFTDYTEAEYVSAFGNNAGYYDGIPFEEAKSLRFNYGTGWDVTPMTVGYTDKNGDQINYDVYLREGVEYTLRLEVTLGSMSEQVQKIENILTALNDAYLTIIKLTGTTPDQYRDYSFSRLLPEVLITMLEQVKELDEVSTFLKDTANTASTYSGICDKLSNLLDKMARDSEDELAKNLDNFKSYVGSLGTFLTDAKTQPLQLDYISIQPAEEKAPKGGAGFFSSIWHEVKSFIASFFRDYNSMGAMETEGVTEHVSVWVPYGRDQANVIRNLSTNDFTQQTNIAVDLKLVAGGTLLPSILAGMGPDVYLGLGQADVINYAIRGALSNIEDNEGFDETVENFNEAAMMVLGIADSDNDMHYYGLPETQGFNMMFVRLDVLADLDIEIPTTWDEIYTAQSKLESNNMEIGMHTDYQIFLYQLGGNLWADEGMRINLDSELGVQSFVTMCDMYTQYSFPYAYEAANRFRTGEMPIIISNYTALYNQLKVFATELDGCWAFVPLPGYERVDEEGNTYIDNSAVSAVSAVVMIGDAKNPNGAWQYMKWYTGATCQSSYANEMVAIMGDSAKHATANRKALESMPWTHDEYVELSKQFDNLASVANYPGYYILGRNTEFAFLAAYNDNADPKTELLSKINDINNEITRKRLEFKLEVLNDPDASEDEIFANLAEKRFAQIRKALPLLEEKIKGTANEAAYKEAYERAMYGIVNKNPIVLDESAELFRAILKSVWNGDTIEITKVNGNTVKVPSYYKNISKQTMETKNGGYSINSLDEQQLLYFISECLVNAAAMLRTY